ncbi:hypothetical protein [Dyadobacter bucti]|uniref:hypothetical protein n=1 Tax=Dyadobacter bucti TaxID=2572203 RepID=UPI003F72DC0F
MDSNELTGQEKIILKKVADITDKINQSTINVEKEYPDINFSKQTMLYKDAIKKYNIIKLAYEKEETRVAVLKGDVVIKGNMDSEWINNQVKELGRNGYMTLIEGNVTIENSLVDDGIAFLFIIGNIKCEEIISWDGHISVSGDADIKFAITGQGNDGYIGIEGKTLVPYVLNDDHDINISPDDSTIFLDFPGREWDSLEISSFSNLQKFSLDNSQHLLRRDVWDEDENFDVNAFTTIIKKGESPFFIEAIRDL